MNFCGHETALILLLFRTKTHTFLEHTTEQRRHHRHVSNKIFKFESCNGFFNVGITDLIVVVVVVCFCLAEVVFFCFFCQQRRDEETKETTQH